MRDPSKLSFFGYPQGIILQNFVDSSWSKGLLLDADIVLNVLPFIKAISGIRHLNKVDGIDDAAKLIYVLKPYGKRNIRQGIR